MTSPESTPLHDDENAQETAKHLRFAPLFDTEKPGMKRRAEEQMACYVARPDLLSSNRTIPLMRRPNTDNAPNKPVTLKRSQLLIRCVVTSPVHTVTIRGNVTSVYPRLEAK
jgi:hypothetical protein